MRTAVPSLLSPSVEAGTLFVDDQVQLTLDLSFLAYTFCFLESGLGTAIRSPSTSSNNAADVCVEMVLADRWWLVMLLDRSRGVSNNNHEIGRSQYIQTALSIFSASHSERERENCLIRSADAKKAVKLFIRSPDDICLCHTVYARRLSLPGCRPVGHSAKV